MFMVAVSHVVERASAYGHGKTVKVFVPSAYYGTFTTRTAAKVAFMLGLEPDLRGAPEAFVVKHFDQQARNLGLAKVVRTPA